MECPSDRLQRPGMVMWFLLSLECRPDNNLRATLTVTCSLPVFRETHLLGAATATCSLKCEDMHTPLFLFSRREPDFGMWEKWIRFQGNVLTHLIYNMSVDLNVSYLMLEISLVYTCKLPMHSFLVTCLVTTYFPYFHCCCLTVLIIILLFYNVESD